MRRAVVVLECDRKGCGRTVTLDDTDPADVRRLAREAGWECFGSVHWCPEHPRPVLDLSLPDDTPGFPMPPRVWTCDVCGKQEVWGPTWRWFGSYAGARQRGPDERVESVVCSPACRKIDQEKRDAQT